MEESMAQTLIEKKNIWSVQMVLVKTLSTTLVTLQNS